MYNIGEINMDQLLSSLIAYEIRITNWNYTSRDAIVKLNKKSIDDQDFSCSRSYEEETKFVRKLNKETSIKENFILSVLIVEE